jgi:hypothetical protein
MIDNIETNGNARAPKIDAKREITYETCWIQCETHDYQVELTYVDGSHTHTRQTGRTRPTSKDKGLTDL